MKHIISDYAKKDYYNFLIENFPWTWGDYKKFVWKHLNEPFLKSKSFYYIKNSDEIESLCVAKNYLYVVKNKTYNVLSMMDFVTNKKYRRQGNIQLLSNYILSSLDYDFAIGFSSEILKKTVYKSKKTLQIYYTYEIIVKRSSLQCEEILDKNIIINCLNSNENALQIFKTQEYINYTMQNPSFDNVIFVKHGSLLVGMDIKKDFVQIIEISKYSRETCKEAIKIAACYGTRVRIDLCEMENLENYKLLKVIYVSIYQKNSLKTLNFANGSIWIPVIDRR